MYNRLIYALALSVLISLIRAERRIINGTKAKDKRYAVYLTKREESLRQYDEWLCGGAIVSPLYIVTSAACVEDVEYMYVIAGYNKYVHPDKLDEDECTKRYKKKVIYVCLPSAYKFNYPDVEKWAWVDIAVAKVESPFDFEDEGYLSVCSYIPNKIEINYDEKYQEPGIDAVALGWGHKKLWRPTNDTRDLNSEYLLGASVRIAEKPKCKQMYGDAYPKILTLIDKYMICTIDGGNLNPAGELIQRTDPSNYTDGCGPKGVLRGSGLCKEDKIDPNDDYFRTRRNNTLENGTVFQEEPLTSRRNGICQNDHGGPLVTWVGAHEVLIGVAAVFRLNSSSSNCIGPYLFTSTWCSSAFLNCVVEMDATDPNARRRNVCDKPLREQGFTLVERDVSWARHPDGPADNEGEEDETPVRMRPQISLNAMYRQKGFN